MGDIVLGGVRLAYEDYGSGDVVVLLGGSAMPGAAWQLSIAPALVEAGFRVVAPDARGVGRSDVPPPPYTLADLTSDVAGLIEALNLQPCRVIGLSLGGFVAENLVWRRPDLVRAAVLVACAGRPTAFVRARIQAEQDLLQVCQPLPASFDQVSVLTVAVPASVLQHDDETVERWLGLLSGGVGQSPDGRIGQVAAERDWVYDEARPSRWPELTRPCLVVAFEHDLCFPPERGHEAAASLPHGSFVEIAGVAHGNGAFDASETLGNVVLDFFASA